MKRALVALIAGTVLSGFAAAYVSTAQAVERPDTKAEMTAQAGN